MPATDELLLLGLSVGLRGVSSQSASGGSAAFFRLPAANHRLVGANYGLAAAYDRLVGANEALRRQMWELKAEPDR